MYAIILGIICVVCLLCVLGYILFSEIKTKPSDNAVFINSDVTWDGIDAVEAYEASRKAPIKATFKGNHSRHNWNITKKLWNRAFLCHLELFHNIKN